MKKLNENVILSSSNDNSIKIWDLRNVKKFQKSISLQDCCVNFEVNLDLNILIGGIRSHPGIYFENDFRKFEFIKQIKIVHNSPVGFSLLEE